MSLIDWLRALYWAMWAPRGWIDIAAVVALVLAIALALESRITRRLPPGLTFVAIAFWAGLRIAGGDGTMLVAAGGAALWLLAVMPLYMTAKYRIPGRLDDQPPTEDAWRLAENQALADDTGQLAHLGFRIAGDLFLWCAAEREVQRHALDETGTVAAHATLHANGRRGFVLTSRQDGRAVRTTDWYSTQAWPAPPGCVTFYHHFCRNVEELLRLHRAHLAQLGVTHPATVALESVLALEQADHAAELADAERRGYLARTADGDYRLTWKGYYRSMLKSILTHRKHRAYRIDSDSF